MIIRRTCAALLCGATLNTVGATTSTPFVPYGYQSGAFVNAVTAGTAALAESEYINDDSFAGSMVYDEDNHVLYVTGGTYGNYFSTVGHHLQQQSNPHLAFSDCFVSVLELPGGNDVRRKTTSTEELVTATTDDPRLIYARKFGAVDAPEACSSLAVLPKFSDSLVASNHERKLVLLGHTEPVDREHSFMTSLRIYDETETEDDVQAAAYGYAMDFDLELNVDDIMAEPTGQSFTDAFGAFLGGRLFDSAPVQYPVSLTPSARSPNEFYVALMVASNAAPSQEYAAMYDEEDEMNPMMHDRPDLTAGGGGGIQKFGQNFYVTVEKIRVKSISEMMAEPFTDEQLQQTMVSSWNFDFKLDGADETRPSALLHVPGTTAEEDVLLLAGTAKFNSNGDGLDGFLTEFKGEGLKEHGDSAPADGEGIQSDSIHRTVKIQTDRDEMIHGLCMAPDGARDYDSPHVYVVGSTSGILDPTVERHNERMHAFLMKIDVKTFETVWKRQIGFRRDAGTADQGGDGDVMGRGCAVTPDGKRVYMSGVASNGVAIDAGNDVTYTSAGGDDVVLAAFDSTYGTLHYAKQLGTKEDDDVAKGGGVTTDRNGNALLLGTTRGNMMRWRGDVHAEPNRETRKLSSTRNLSDRDDPALHPHSSPADVFLMSFERHTGECRTPVEQAMREAAEHEEANQEPDWLEEAEHHYDDEDKENNGLSGAGKAFISLFVITGTVAAALFVYRKKVGPIPVPTLPSFGRSPFSHDDSRSQATNDANDHLWDDDTQPNLAAKGGLYSDGESISSGSRSSSSHNPRSFEGAAHTSYGYRDDHRSVSPDRDANNGRTNGRGSIQDVANSTLSRMFDDGELGPASMSASMNFNESLASNRGSSVKGLLNHYREVRKSKVFGDSANSNNKRPSVVDTSCFSIDDDDDDDLSVSGSVSDQQIV